MHYRNGKLVIALSLLLILSQWLSLAHATEHVTGSGDAYCQVCTLQQHYQSALADTTAGTEPVIRYSYLSAIEPELPPATPESSRAIRAPPL